MSHTVAFKLNKPAQQFAAGDSQGFGIRGGVKFYNRTTKAEEWTNYEAVIFAKHQNQIDFCAKNLVADAVITISGDSIQVKQFNGNNGLQITLALNNARIEYIASPPQIRAPDAAQQAHEAGMKMQPAQRAPQHPAGFDSFDYDIPF